MKEKVPGMSTTVPGGGSSENAPFFVDHEVITLTRDGVWIADGTEISHEPTRRLFARSLQRDEQGWLLAIGRETKRIRVEDTAYFIQRIDGNHRNGFTLWVSDGTKERLDPASLRYAPGRLTCRIRGGIPGASPSPGVTPRPAEEAKFLRGPYIELLREITEERGSYYLEIEGKRVRLAESSAEAGKTGEAGETGERR